MLLTFFYVGFETSAKPWIHLKKKYMKPWTIFITHYFMALAVSK